MADRIDHIINLNCPVLEKNIQFTKKWGAWSLGVENVPVCKSCMQHFPCLFLFCFLIPFFFPLQTLYSLNCPFVVVFPTLLAKLFLKAHAK